MQKYDREKLEANCSGVHSTAEGLSNSQILQTLRVINSTLNQVEVKGKKNIEYMFGSLATLETLISQLSEKEDEVIK